jgi:aldehyde dehydrogenase
MRDRAVELGRIEYEETRIGRPAQKPDKLILAADRTQGIEALAGEVWSGDHGITVVEHAPWGVIGIVTPVTHSVPTLGSNAIQMIAAGNAIVCNPHPNGAKCACYAAQLFNLAIRDAIGVENLICLIEKPTLETANEIFYHPDIRMLCITGGPGVVKAAMKAPKKVICAGPGNPPVVVDETADIDRAARCIIVGAAFDNNLLCLAEKEVFAVDAVYDQLKAAMKRHGAYELNREQVQALAKAAFKPDESGNLALNKALVGKDPQVLADQIGLKLPPNVELLFGDCPGTCPFVEHEQMMPFIPFVRCKDVDEAIERALKAEHGYGHTSIIHSKNVDNMTKMGKAMNTTLFIKNGPSMAGVGVGGEGTNSYSIATPTGEGPTTPLTFTRVRRCVMVDNLRII